MPRTARTTTATKSTARKSTGVRKSTAAKAAPAKVTQKAAPSKVVRKTAPAAVPAKRTPAKSTARVAKKVAPAKVESAKAATPVEAVSNYGLPAAFLADFAALLVKHNLAGASSSVGAAPATSVSKPKTAAELQDMGTRQLRTLARSLGYDADEVQKTSAEALRVDIYAYQNNEASYADAIAELGDDEDVDDEGVDDEDAESDEEDTEETDDEESDEEEDSDEEDDEEGDDDEGDEEEAPARYTAAQFRPMKLDRIRQILIDDGFEEEDLEGADKAEMVAWYLEADEEEAAEESDEEAGDEDEDTDSETDEDEESDDEDDGEYTEDELMSWSEGELKETCKEYGIAIKRGWGKPEMVKALMEYEAPEDDEDNE